MYLPTSISGFSCAALIFLERSVNMTFNDLRGYGSGNMLTSMERHHISPKIARVEGNVNTRKRDCSKASFKLDVDLGFLLGFGMLKALNDDVTQHFLHFLGTVCFCQLQKKVSVLFPSQPITVQYTFMMSIFCILR